MSVVEVAQLNEDDLKRLSPEQIAQAFREGKLARLLGREVPVPLVDEPPAGAASGRQAGT